MGKLYLTKEETVELTKKEAAEYFLSEGWATIGGRIEDYAKMINNHPKEDVYNMVEQVYGDLAEEVWNGILVFINFGVDAYYDEKELILRLIN